MSKIVLTAAAPLWYNILAVEKKRNSGGCFRHYPKGGVADARDYYIYINCYGNRACRDKEITAYHSP